MKKLLLLLLLSIGLIVNSSAEDQQSSYKDTLQAEIQALETSLKKVESQAREAEEQAKTAELIAKEAEAKAKEIVNKATSLNEEIEYKKLLFSKLSSFVTVISIDKDGNYYINSIINSGIEESEEFGAVSLNIIVNKVKSRINIYPEMKIFIRADKDVAYGKVIELISQLKNEGVAKVGFVTENLEKPSISEDQQLNQSTPTEIIPVDAEIIAAEKQRLAEQEALKAKAKQVMAEVQRKAEEAKALEAIKRKELAEAKAIEAEARAIEAAKQKDLSEAKAKEAEEKAQVAVKFRILAEEATRIAIQLSKEEQQKLNQLEAERAAEQEAFEKEQYNRLLTQEVQAEQDLANSLIIEDQLNTLKSAYVANIAARVKSYWHYQGAETDWSCNVFVQQDKNGRVEIVNVQNCNTGDSTKARTFKNSIERAVYKASPLPPAPDDAVFAREILFVFRTD